MIDFLPEHIQIKLKPVIDKGKPNLKKIDSYITFRYTKSAMSYNFRYRYNKKTRIFSIGNVSEVSYEAAFQSARFIDKHKILEEFGHDFFNETKQKERRLDFSNPVYSLCGKVLKLKKVNSDVAAVTLQIPLTSKESTHLSFEVDATTGIPLLPAFNHRLYYLFNMS